MATNLFPLGHLAAWLRIRNVHLAASLGAAGLVGMLGEVSVADAEAVIQAAVNRAIGRGHTPVMVTRQDVLLAIELVMG